MPSAGYDLAMSAAPPRDYAYAYGMISASTILLLRDDFAFPPANTYAEIAQTLPSIGGEAANSAIVLAKLGLPTKLDGNWLRAERAPEIQRRLEGFGIDVSRLSRHADFGTQEIVIADKTTRTVFGNYASFHRGPKQWNDPQPDDICGASIVCLDPYFREESRRVAELCVQHGKPYVTLDCRYDDYLAQHAASVVVSHELRDQAYAGSDLREVFRQYQQSCKGLTIFTFGSDPLWYGRPQEEPTLWKPWEVDAVDTTGAGDSFRGAIAYGLWRGWDDAKTVQFASAVAACVCMTAPHALNAPGLDDILAFLDRQVARRAASSK